jgi:hypothetical protein
MQEIRAKLASDNSNLSKYLDIDTVDADLFSLNLELDKVLNDRTKILSNKSRLKWLEFGEKSNKYFLNLNKSFQNSSYFKSFINQGKEVFDSASKIKVVHDFYSQLYDYHENENSNSFLSSVNVGSLNMESNNVLKAPITKNELVAVLKSSGDTASGPDGIGYKLLKTCWSFYGDVLINSWNYALTTGLLAPSHRESVICLLQKKGKDKRIVGNLRPITLSNCDIKVITKALTKRCNKILNDVLNPHQTAYIPGRIVHDNLRTIDMVKDCCVSYKVDGYLVSLDAKKAFDSVDHKFIDDVLCKFNVCLEFRNIVKLLYNCLTSRVLVNGHLTDKFELRRSVKQGDALSCVLFIMCMETIINKIEQDKAVTNIKINGLNIPKVVAFADDIAILTADKPSIVNAINLYSLYSKCSGLYLNVDKTEVMNLKEHLVEDNLMLEGTESQTSIKLTESITICGKTFSLNNVLEHDKNVGNKIDNLQKALNSWSKRSLSIFGRNLILKTFGLSQIIYSMQSSIFNESDFIRIEKICFNYLWNKKHDKVKAYERISRNKLKCDYNSGGINAPDVRSMYKALVLKQLLRSTSSKCKHYINIIQGELARWNSEVIFQRIPKSFPNAYINRASEYYRYLGEIIINEVVKCDENSKLAKTYYDLIASEHPLAVFSQLLPNSITLSYLKNAIKIFGFKNIGQLINEFKFPSSDKHRQMISLIVKSTKVLQILSSRRELAYGTLHIDNFIVATNKFMPLDKLTTKVLRLRFLNGCETPVTNPLFKSLKSIMHPKEREILFFDLHNVIISNAKLNEMKILDSPDCDICNDTQTSEHIFKLCINATVAWKAFNENPNSSVSPYHRSNIESLIKRLLYLNRNKKINIDLFRTAITNRIDDLNYIALTKKKRKDLNVINKISLL